MSAPAKPSALKSVAKSEGVKFSPDVKPREDHGERTSTAASTSKFCNFDNVLTVPSPFKALYLFFQFAKGNPQNFPREDQDQKHQ